MSAETETLEVRVRDVTWADALFCGFRAILNGRQIGSVSYSVKRGDPLPWHAHFELFGAHYASKYATPEAAKAGFIRRLNEAIRKATYIADTDAPSQEGAA